MALQDALEKIGEYNAAMELPNSGLLGIGAFLAEPPEPEIARKELRIFVEISTAAEKVLAYDEAAVRKNIHLYSALNDIFRSGEERQDFLKALGEMRRAFESLIKSLEGESVSNVPSKRRLNELSARLQSLSDNIKHAIPRDSYLASLTGGTHPGLGTGR